LPGEDDAVFRRPFATPSPAGRMPAQAGDATMIFHQQAFLHEPAML
jgi:hypothetical protein